MRCCVLLLLLTLTGCMGAAPPPPTSPPGVAGAQTEAAALYAVATAHAMAVPPTYPPVEATRAVLAFVYDWSALIAAGARSPATATAALATQAAAAATLTALPTNVVP